MAELPVDNFKRIIKSLFGKSSYPVSMILLEVAGNFAGPWALFRSWLRVKKMGRSTLDLSPAGRTAGEAKTHHSTKNWLKKAMLRSNSEK
jgi:hypothetical protein